MKLTVALMNSKAGTGKTTAAVFLAYAFAERGPVLLVDADPAGSAFEWSDVVICAEENQGEGFPFEVISLPSTTLHQQLPGIAGPGDVVIIDTPQTEDHAAIAGSVLRIADEIVITCAPATIEVNRTMPITEQIEAAARLTPARISILLNRAIASSGSLRNAREVLTELGYHVLRTSISRSETDAQSFGVKPRAIADPWRAVVRELLDRAGLATDEDRRWLAEIEAEDKK